MGLRVTSTMPSRPAQSRCTARPNATTRTARASSRSPTGRSGQNFRHCGRNYTAERWRVRRYRSTRCAMPVQTTGSPIPKHCPRPRAARRIALPTCAFSGWSPIGARGAVRRYATPKQRGATASWRPTGHSFSATSSSRFHPGAALRGRPPRPAPGDCRHGASRQAALTAIARSRGRRRCRTGRRIASSARRAPRGHRSSGFRAGPASPQRQRARPAQCR